MPPDEALTWRDGAYLKDKDKDSHPAPASAPTDRAGAGCDDILFDDTPKPLKRPPAACLKGVNSIARLTAERAASGASGELGRFKKALVALRTTRTETLVLKIATAADPLMLWALHVTLDKRGIAPCLRWPKNNSTPQMEFITWLTDVQWLTRRSPTHLAKFKSWQQLFSEAPESAVWREKAYWIFVNMYGHQNLSSYGARGLALTPDQRQPLMMFPTAAMVKARLALQPAEFAEIRERLYSYSIEHPDSSGQRTPEAIAGRREGLWRVFILSGKNIAATAENWRLTTGEPLTRQAALKQVTIIKAILKSWP